VTSIESHLKWSRFESHGLGQMKSTSKLPSSKFRRHEPKADLQWAEQVLFEEMEHAAELLQSEEDFGRSGARHAVHACYSFLHARGLSGQGLKALIDLVAALDSVTVGVLPEVFDPKFRPGEFPERKWSRSAASRETKVYAAACMDALMKNGASKPEAAARVARRAAGWPRLFQGEIKKSTVTNWRDELFQGPSNDPDRRRFEAVSRNLSDGSNAKSYLEDILRWGPVMTAGVRRKRKPET
jgi:hypothetical protein